VRGNGHRPKSGALPEVNHWQALFRRSWSMHLDALEGQLDRMQSTPAGGNKRENEMNDRQEYTTGPAYGAEVRKGGDQWTLILVRELRHPPEKVWRALTDPAHLREWAPFEVDGSLGAVGTVKLTWTGTPTALETKVTRADAPKVLEYGDTRWELEALGSGTRLTLWHNIDRRYVSWGAAGWHIAFDVLDRLLSGAPIGRIVGGDAMKFAAWRRLVAEYSKQFDMEPPKWG